MAALTKADIAEKLFNQIGLNKREAKDFIDDFFEEMRIALENGQHIKLSSFGNFILRDKVSRPGRNPKTGKEATVSARRVVTFKPSQQLKSLIEEKLKQRAKKQKGKE